jgi:CcmD family protein
MRTLLLVFVAALGFSAAAPVPSALAQATAPAVQAAPATAAPSPGAAALPRYTQPRTLRAYWHLFIAFAVAWLLVFGYTVSIARRFGRIERELEALEAR